MHMRVRTFIHQYQYRYTNTEGYDDAFIIRGDFFTLATSKVSTWAVLATCPMESSFQQGSFQKPSVLSAQAARSGSSRDPVPKILYFFRKRFRTRACTDLQCTFAQKCFFLQRKKVCSKDRIGYAAWGLPQGPAFACTLTMSNKTKKQKLKKTQVLFGNLI